MRLSLGSPLSQIIISFWSSFFLIAINTLQDNAQAWMVQGVILFVDSSLQAEHTRYLPASSLLPQYQLFILQYDLMPVS